MVLRVHSSGEAMVLSKNTPGLRQRVTVQERRAETQASQSMLNHQNLLRNCVWGAWDTGEKVGGSERSLGHGLGTK